MVLSPCLSVHVREWKWPMVWSPWKTVFWVSGTLIISTHSRQPVSWWSFSACPRGLIKFNHFMETTRKNHEWGSKRCVKGPSFSEHIPGASVSSSVNWGQEVSYTYWEGQMKKWISRLLKVKSAESVKQHSWVLFYPYVSTRCPKASEGHVSQEGVALETSELVCCTVFIT